MRHQPRRLLEVIGEKVREVLSERLRPLREPTWGREPDPPEPCKFQVSKFEESTDVEEPDRFNVPQEWCNKKDPASYDRAKKLLDYWEGKDPSWRGQRNARDLNRVGCLYIWVDEDYKNALKLFQEAGQKATDEEKAIIKPNRERVEEWLSRKSGK